MKVSSPFVNNPRYGTYRIGGGFTGGGTPGSDGRPPGGEGARVGPPMTLMCLVDSALRPVWLIASALRSHSPGARVPGGKSAR